MGKSENAHRNEKGRERVCNALQKIGKRCTDPYICGRRGFDGSSEEWCCTFNFKNVNGEQ